MAVRPGPVPIDPLFEYCLRLGDNCLILGHRLSEWLSRAPALEEDLALANVSLDLIGQTRLWLGLAAAIEGAGRDADKLAYLRDAGAFRNILLVEQPNGDFALTMARQYFFDVWHFLLLEGLARSSDVRVAEIAAKSLREVAYHAERSRDWLLRLGDGTEESHRRMQRAVDDLWVYTGEMFAADEIDRAVAASGVGIDPETLRPRWSALVEAGLREATLIVPPAGWTHKGGKTGRHSEHLGFLLAEMQFLQRAYPGAQW